MMQVRVNISIYGIAEKKGFVVEVDFEMHDDERFKIQGTRYMLQEVGIKQKFIIKAKTQYHLAFPCTLCLVPCSFVPSSLLSTFHPILYTYIMKSGYNFLTLHTFLAGIRSINQSFATFSQQNMSIQCSILVINTIQ